MAFLRIVLLCVALAIVYGILHDQVTARICLEYFTIGHPPVIESTSPTALAFTWGVLATWWMGLLLGVLLAVVCRVGSRSKLTWWAVLRPALLLLAVTAVLAFAAGLAGWALATADRIRLAGPLAERVPADRQVDFLTCLWAHLASYAVGALGGIVLAVLLWRRRGRTLGASALVLLALGLCGCMETKETVRIQEDGSGRFVQTVRIDIDARDDLLRRLARLGGAEEDPERLPFADPFRPEWIRARAQGVRGYVLERVERKDEDGTRVTIVVARFKQLRDAAEAGAFFTAHVRLEPVEKDVWKLVVSDAWAEPLGDPDGELAGRPAKKLVEALRESLAGHRIERTFVLPGKVLKTNGKLADDGRTVSWTADLEKLLAGKDLVLEVTFRHGDGATLQRFRHRPDPDDLMVRALEAPPGAVDAGR